MTIRLSQGLKAGIYGLHGITALLGYGFIEVYSGEQPATANDAATGTLLGYISESGNGYQPGSTAAGLRLQLNSAGQLEAAGTWMLTGVATGTAGWWRWRWNRSDDAGQQSLYFPRIDGAVGESLILASTAISPATNEQITTFVLQFLEAA